MKTNSKRGDGGVTFIIILAVAVVAYMAPKPKIFDSRSREADAAEKAVAQSNAAEEAKAATVSASVNQIAVAAGQLPDSPQQAFITREASFISPLLPAPDPKKLLEAERRRVALLEGKLELADKLYAAGTKDNAALLSRAVKAEAKADAAIGQLQESAAYARGQEQIIGILIGIAVLFAAGWIYTKFTTLPKIDIARIANRARDSGGNIVEALDAVVPDSWHDGIAEIAARLRGKEAAKKAAREAAAKA